MERRASLLWVAFLSLLLLWPVYAFLAKRDSRKGYVSRGDLGQIIKAITTYQEPNNEWLPPSLWALYPAYIDDQRFLEAVVGPPQGDGQWWHRCHYLFPGGVDGTTLVPDTRVAIFPYDRYENGTVRLITLFFAGNVRHEDVTQEELGAILSGGQRP